MLYLVVFLGLAAASAGTLIFASLTYSLRDYSRPALENRLAGRKQERWLEFITAHTSDLVFATAAARLLFNLAILILVLRLFHETQWHLRWQYGVGVLLAAAITLLCSVTIPHAIARHSAARTIALAAPLLGTLHSVARPILQMSHLVDALVRRLAGVDREEIKEEQIEQEILSAVHEGEKEGVVNSQERVIIESVIQFRDTHAGEIMTARADIVALAVDSSLEDVKQMVESSGHSRVPVYEGSLDNIKGILYARDLLKYVGSAVEHFDLRASLRPALFIPKSKPVSVLLADFRTQKVHLVIVQDEYGGTAGLVTIEDVLEELVGEISDEHEPKEPAFVQQTGDGVFEADARAPIMDINKHAGLELPEDQGYDTLGGFISTTLGQIPRSGTTFEHQRSRYTVLDAEPQRIKRVRIEKV